MVWRSLEGRRYRKWFWKWFWKCKMRFFSCTLNTQEFAVEFKATREDAWVVIAKEAVSAAIDGLAQP